MEEEIIPKEANKENTKENEDLSGPKQNESSVMGIGDSSVNILERPSCEPRNSLQNFINDSSRFSNVNPLRNNKFTDKENKKTTKEKSKKKIIEELVTNLRTQYVLYNIKDYMRKYFVRINPEINTKSYKILRIFRNICLLLYGILMFFEKPWFCYKGTTIKLSAFNFLPDECERNYITFAKIPFIDSIILRSIEIIITIIIFVTQILKYKDEYYLVTSNDETIDKSYKIMNIIILIALVICLIDLFAAIITGLFPIINFLLRAFIYIYLTRRLRTNWSQIGKVLWRTRAVFLYLVLNILIFSLVGYVLFKTDTSKFFPNFIETILQLYILLSTCNFPDIMLDTFPVSKFSVFYFIIYVTINYFIILSYLKTLYYTKYYSVTKEECIDIIKKIILKKENQSVFELKNFKKFIVNQKKKYSLNDDEYKNVLTVLNLYDKNDDKFADLTKIVERNPEDELARSSKIGNYILKDLITEIIINIINLLSLAFLFIGDNLLLKCLHLIWSFIIPIEFVYLVYSLGIKRVLTRHFNRVIFHFFNLVSIILIIILLCLSIGGDENNYKKVYTLFCIFIGLRSIRIFVFLDKFKEIKIIYAIIRISKEMFYRNLITLYSLYLLFSTLSILLTGGTIKIDSFDFDDSIPPNYTHINFNDFGSSYIACFSLMMINNLNILVKSLSYGFKKDDIKSNFFKFYFASFYFFSTLIIANIIQTLLLEMYLNSGYTTSDVNEKKEKLNESKNEKEENKNNEHKIE